MYYRFFCLLILHIIACPGISLGQAFVYTDSEGGITQLLNVRKKQERGGLMLYLNSEIKNTRHFYQPPGHTVEWKLIDHAEKHDFYARRHGNQIAIEGIYQGKPITKTVDVDEKPWINKLDHGLSNWARSEEDELVFWTLKLNSGLDPILFKAEKLGTENLETPAGKFQTVKVKLNLNGFLLSNLWSAYCWYRVSDGLFVKYEGDSGPGTHLRMIELQRIQ